MSDKLTGEPYVVTKWIEHGPGQIEAIEKRPATPEDLERFQAAAKND